MPVTSFALIILLAAAVAALGVVALKSWGVMTVLAIAAAVALFARWAMADVPFDDRHP